jgi:thiamine kinase-like enzyme
VDLVGGGVVKARRLESQAAGEALVALRAGLEDAFVPVLACHDGVLLEAWVEGHVLAGAAAGRRANEVAALLARLHAHPRPEAPAYVATSVWQAKARGHLERLGSAGALAPAAVRTLHEELLRSDPGRAVAALVHRDLCPENIVVDAAGRLNVVDNEWFDVDAAGLDLGRTLVRWPLGGAAQEDFLRAYHEAAHVDPGPLGFWALVAALWSARTRLGQSTARQQGPLALLARMATGDVPLLACL